MARASKPLPTGHDPSHVATQNWKDLHPEVQTHFGNSNAFRAWKKRQQPQGPTPEEHTAAGLIDQAKAHPKVRIETWSGDEAPQAWDVHNPAENLDTALRRVGGHSLDIIIPGESATRVTSGEGTGAPDIHTEQPIAVRHRLRRDQDYNPASPSGGYRPASATATGRRRGADTAAHPAQGATGTPAQVPGAASQDALEKAVADLDRARAQVTEPRDFDDPDLNAIAKKVSDPEKGRADLRDKVAKSPGAARAAVTAVEETGKARQRAADAAERVVKNTAAVTADKVPTPPDVLQWRKRTPSELNPGVEYEDYDQSDEERAARAKENAEKAGASSDSDSAPTSGVDASPQFSDLRDVAADVGDAVGFDPKEDDYAELERKLGRTKDVLAGGWRIQTNVPSSTETSLGGPDVEQRADAYASGVGVGVQHPDRGSVDVTGGIHPVNAPAQSHPYAQRRLKMAQRIAGSVPRPPSQGSTSPAMPGFETDKGQTTQPRGYDVPEVSTEDIPESQYREPSGQTAPARKEQEPKTPSEMVAEFGTQTTGQAKREAGERLAAGQANLETLTTERQERAEAPAAPQPSGRTQAEAEAYKGPAPKQPTLFGSDAEYGDQAPDNTYERPTMPPGGVSKRMPGQGTLFGTSLPKGRASKGRQLQPDIPYPTSGSRVVRTAPRPEPPSERLGDLEDVHAASAGMPDVDLTSGSSGAPATQIPESQAATARTPEEHITRLVGAGLTNTTNVPVSDTDVNAYAEQNKPLIATASRRAAQRARQRNRPTGGQ